MKLKLIFIFFLVLANSSSFAQDECGTEDITEKDFQALPWYGNNAFLEQYADSLANVFSGANARVEGNGEQVWYRIPVKFWVFNDSTKGVRWTLQTPERALKAAMWSLNEAFRRNSVPIRFYMLCPEYIEDNQLFTKIKRPFYLYNTFKNLTFANTNT